MKKLISGLVMLLLLIYPLWVYYGLSQLAPRYLALSLGFIVLLRFIIAKPNIEQQSKLSLYLITVLGLTVSLTGMIFDSTFFLKLYPVFMNALFFGWFFYSLVCPPALITLFAQQLEKQPLTSAMIVYTKKVTIVWCLFFVMNGLAALVTALYASLAVWTLYNGLIAYILIGLIFVIEYGIRLHLKKRQAQKEGL